MRISDWSSDVCSSDLKFASAWNPDRSTDRRNGQRIIRRTATQCGAEPLGADVQRVAEGGRREVSSARLPQFLQRSEEHTSELQSLMRISYAVFCLKKKNHILHTPLTLPSHCRMHFIAHNIHTPPRHHHPL